MRGVKTLLEDERYIVILGQVPQRNLIYFRFTTSPRLGAESKVSKSKALVGFEIFTR